MALLSLNRIAWEYSDDKAVSHRVAAQKALTDQAVLGGIAWAGIVGPLSADILRMRRITVRNAAQGVSRVVPMYEAGADIAQAGTSINVNHLVDSYAFLSDGNPLAEVRKRHSVTRQST